MPSHSGQLPRSTDARRVVVTGVGMVTSLGTGWDANAAGFREGALAFRDITVFDASAQRVAQAGEVIFPNSLPAHALSKRELERLDRPSRLLLHAGTEAWEMAGWGDAERSSPIPLSLGTSAGAMHAGEAFCRGVMEGGESRRGEATLVHQYLTQRQAMTLASALDIEGPISIFSNACASGANAIGEAFHGLKYGLYPGERVIAGGYDALAQLVFAGFDSLQALTTTLPPRPFDANRDGLALGEGAAMFCLETRESAERRGANILAEVSGYGSATDVHHLTQPHPDGDAALSTMQMACAEAGLTAEEVDYVNSHGTGTPLNDVAEGRAIQRWAESAVGGVKVSSTKASIGHLLGAAGAVEAGVCLMAMQGGWVPPTTTVETPDPICTFDLVRTPREAEVKHALTNSFGFGGANATLVFKKGGGA